MTDLNSRATAEPKEQRTKPAAKRQYKSPHLEDYGTVNIRTQTGYGYGADGGSSYYTFGGSGS